MQQRLVHPIGIGFLTILLPLGLFAQEGLVSPNRLVIQGGTLISGTGSAPLGSGGASAYRRLPR